MERLEKAIAKARTQRLSSGSTSFRRPPHGRDLGAVPPLAPVYRETSIVPFDATALERNKVISSQAGHPVADVYRSLRARVLQQLSRSEKTTLGVTSAHDGEGKTLTAVNLAVSMAMDVNQTVLLVDLDLREPSIHKFFGIEPKLGIDDHLLGRAGVGECLVNPGIDRLVLLPAKGSHGNSAELLSSPQMARLAAELRQRFADRIIIYDLPPLLTVGDTLGFLPNVESTLLVVRDGATRRPELVRALDLLRDSNLICTVLNASH